MGLYSFMLDTKPTTGSIETNDATKRKLAMESLEYNVKNEKLFCTLFPEYVDLWNRREEERKAKLVESGGSAATADEDDERKIIAPKNTVGVLVMNDVLAFGAGFVAILSLFFAILRFC